MTSVADLLPAQKGRVVDVISLDSDEDDVLVRRLLELGFLPGETVELRHRAPFGGGPLAVAIRGTVIGLRRREAEHILVEKM